MDQSQNTDPSVASPQHNESGSELDYEDDTEHDYNHSEKHSPGNGNCNNNRSGSRSFDKGEVSDDEEIIVKRPKLKNLMHWTLH